MKTKSFLFSLLLLSNFCFSQDDNADTPPVTNKSTKGFHLGIYTGTLFANKYTASLYDGYGWDWNGNKNSFYNSFIYNKIWIEYGAHGAFSGQPDRIATALGVQHTDWFFDETDMPRPNSLKYNIAFLVGLQGRYCFDKKSAVLFSVNGSKLTVNGDFQITVTPISAQTGIPGNTNYRTFSIVGGEQRMIFQTGYQRIMGDDPKLNFLWEAGPVVTLVKFERNLINISGLTIPLTTYYNPYGMALYNARNLTGVGFGAFAGLGMNISISPKWTIQLVYDASFEQIKLGQGPKLKLQHAIGFRAYYNL